MPFNKLAEAQAFVQLPHRGQSTIRGHPRTLTRTRSNPELRRAIVSLSEIFQSSGTPIFVGSQVLVNSNGRLGIAASSARFKRDIRDMGDASGRLMKLRPVTFRYKEDPNGTMEYGLVAEEVARIYPELVTNGDDGKPETVAYHLLPAMLLNELQKQVRENQRKDAQLTALKKQIKSLQRETARIDTLVARVSVLEQQAGKTGPEPLAAAMR